MTRRASPSSQKTPKVFYDTEETVGFVDRLEILSFDEYVAAYDRCRPYAATTPLWQQLYAITGTWLAGKPVGGTGVAVDVAAVKDAVDVRTVDVADGKGENVGRHFCDGCEL